METYKNLKRRVARAMLCVFALHAGIGTAQSAGPGPGPTAHAIDTGAVDLRVLTPTSAQINNARLVSWRTGGTYATPPAAAAVTFQYFTTGGNQNVNLRKNNLVKDNTANDQGDLWSDNAIELDYQSPNDLNLPAILIYTFNKDNGGTDPLHNVALRGGIVGCNGNLSLIDQTIGGSGPSILSCSDLTNAYRASVVPLLWKAVGLPDIQADSQANVNGTNPVSNALYMPTEIVSTAGGSCPLEGPYPAVTRTPDPVTKAGGSGFCDFSTHFITDQNNNSIFADPGAVSNSWYTAYSAADPARNVLRRAAFDYSTIVGPFGPALTENGTGAGVFVPAYFVLGMKSSVALRAKYGTTIFLEVLSE